MQIWFVKLLVTKQDWDDDEYEIQEDPVAEQEPNLMPIDQHDSITQDVEMSKMQKSCQQYFKTKFHHI